jgi:hypothetical protein
MESQSPPWRIVLTHWGSSARAGLTTGFARWSDEDSPSAPQPTTNSRNKIPEIVSIFLIFILILFLAYDLLYVAAVGADNGSCIAVTDN